MPINISREKLLNFYSSGMSMPQIAQNLNCSVHKIVYWMDKYKISRRSTREAVYLQANPNGDPFKIKKELTFQENLLFGLGLGLYWGEGEKTSKGHMRVTNSDPYVILKFRDFLKNICQVTESRIHYYLIGFNDSNPQEILNFWAKILNISKEKFGKIVQIAPQGKGTYKKKSQYGVCTIEVSNTKLKNWIMLELNKFKA